ncbi:DUF58 domain-containing protein [Alteromonas stellipolaris]|uniref:DUF58 domain-containing protein n=1 Tax=Alteromonas stellipolaris TaxID=233316 RepID=UPI0007B44A94|nr:DUF58 domain-containing protein [Alteromonas stellipolaris]ANB26562.1 hypothetical protein A6F57_16025 [Alteromonas stellipolaris]MDO6535736.1 DUF58 domain-containing protein [Alteromonas stellipolaris]MDO6625734.1 DUF58 domain-containing protein [Alteromonas stellipolaris]
MSDVHSQLALLQTNGVNLSTAELLRYQQLAKLFSLAPKRSPQARLAGSYLTKHKGRGMEFDEARHYQPGDDIRAIDWRVTARTGKTHTKIYREERERPVFLFCDFSPSMMFGTRLLTKSMQVAHICSLISWSAAAHGDKVGALLFNQSQHKEVKPLARKRAVLHICHELMDLHATSHEQVASAEDDTQAFADACARLRRLARPGSLVYLLSDFQHLGSTAQQHLSQLSRHCEVRAIIVDDPIEHSLPQTRSIQRVSVSDGINQQRWLLGDRKEEDTYQRWREQQNSAMEQSLKQANISRYHISAGLPLDTQIQGMQQERF